MTERRNATPSLSMEFEHRDDGTWVALAEWLDEPVEAESFESAYWEALRRRAASRAA